VKHLAQSYVRIEAVQAALKSMITLGPSGRLRGDFRQRGSLFPLCDFLRGFILAVFISPSAFSSSPAPLVSAFIPAVLPVKGRDERLRRP
jgi:hypothetical protein